MYEDEFLDAESDDGPGTNVFFARDDEESKQPKEETKTRAQSQDNIAACRDDEFEEIEEEPNIVTIKTLTPSS